MYGTRSNGKKHGDVFTSAYVVKCMLDIAEYTPDRDLSNTIIIEPACGEGEFIVEIVERLSLSAQKFGFNLNDAINRCITCFDVDLKKIQLCKQRILSLNRQIKIIDSIFRHEDFLLAENVHKADLIIGNPPYVRHEQIPVAKKEEYRKTYITFRYRADLYIPFFEKSLNLLNLQGKHCFICSNRWLKNQYGYGLRNMISSSFNLKKIINLEKVNPFQEDVIAYPAISLIVNQPSDGYFEYSDIEDISTISVQKEHVSKYLSPTNGDWSDTFNVVKSKLQLTSIENLGFKVGIGVATGADKIFIGKHLIEEVEKEVLIPIVTSKDVKDNDLKWNGNFLFNPFDEKGNIIDLEKFPKAYSYMLTHKERLQERHISQKNPSFWFRTIDKIHKSLVSQPKILLPDISANNYILIDNGSYYPHHNLYYITGKNIDQLKILSAVLMSDFIIKQLSNLANSMNGGYPRWQSQYVRKLKVPDISTLHTNHSQQLISCYDSKDIKGINSIVNSVLA